MTDIRCFYLAGPIRGIPQFNWPAFNAVSSCLKSQGYEVISPVDLDRDMGYSFQSPDDYLAATRKLFANSVFNMILDADAVLLLPGWKKSRGAMAEIMCAKAIDLPLFVWEDGVIWPFVDDQPDGELMQEVIDITSGDRQDSYGPPEKDFGIAARRLNILWEDKFKPGESLDAIDVGLALIEVKGARTQHRRKFDNFRDLAGYDRCVAGIFLNWERTRLGGPVKSRNSGQAEEGST